MFSYVSYPWLLPIFCLFYLAYSRFPALPPCLQTRTGANLLQFDWSWKQNNLLLNTHFVLVGKVVNLFERTFAPFLLSSFGINTSFFKYDNYWKWSSHAWIQVILYLRSNLWQTRAFNFLRLQTRWLTLPINTTNLAVSLALAESPEFIWLVWESLLSWRFVLKRLKLQLCCPQKNRICFYSRGQNKWISLNDSIFSKVVGSRVVIKLSAAEITFYFIYLSVSFPDWELAQGIVSTWAQQNGQVLISVFQEGDKSWKNLPPLCCWAPDLY